MKKSKKDLFLQLANPDEDGFSHEVSVEEFIGEYAELKLGNGGSWCRDDSSLGNEFNIVRLKNGSKITTIRLEGKKKQKINKAIRNDITKAISLQRCVVLATSKPEVDHKDGRYDDNTVANLNTQDISHFQPLSKAANNAKRQHCKNCKDSGVRFDATKLGYSKPVLKGGTNYNGSCIGCYWYDPKKFNEGMSKNFCI
ncbi:MAG: hypothetical protein FWE37_00740 [Spirochaetaceae bacterium]|nr:hypothetical protein [Spirochaetaceae bacterium]